MQNKLLRFKGIIIFILVGLIVYNVPRNLIFRHSYSSSTKATDKKKYDNSIDVNEDGFLEIDNSSTKEYKLCNFVYDNHNYCVTYYPNKNQYLSDEDGIQTITFGKGEQIIIYDYTIESRKQVDIYSLNGGSYNATTMNEYKNYIDEKNIKREDLIQNVKEYFLNVYLK